MKKLLTRLFFFISCVVFCACPYVDHDTSKAARFTSYEEIQGCYEGGTPPFDGYPAKKMYCTRICFDEDAAVISKKGLYITEKTIDSSVVDSIDFDTTYSATYELILDLDSDGTYFYSININNFDKLAYRENDAFNGNKSPGEYTKERIAICDF